MRSSRTWARKRRCLMTRHRKKPTTIRTKTSGGEVAEQAEEGLAALGDVAEEAAGEEKGERPEQRAGEVVEQEARVRHAGLAGDGRRDGGEPGNEFREEQGLGAATGEVALGLGDAGGGLEREAAEQADDAGAVAAAQGVPERVGDEAGGDDSEKRGRSADAMRGAEGACGEQHGMLGMGMPSCSASTHRKRMA